MIRRLLVSIALFLSMFSGALLAQTASRDFDHVRTGFALTGSHANVRCESCHVGGIFRGTPRDCASCHVGGSQLSRSNVVKPASHFPTQLACDSCHSVVTFAGAKFGHKGVASNACAGCHNGSTTVGKPSGHMQTQASCGSCHKSTTTWVGAKPDHSLFNSATNCASCHNGSAAVGKAATHIPTGVNCISCHNVSGWKPTKWNHSQMPVSGQCATCHSGGFPPASGVTPNHVPYKSLSGVAIANCDSCHKGGTSSWNPGTLHNNVALSTQCATCHATTSYGATGKPGHRHPQRPDRVRELPQVHQHVGWSQA